MLQQHRQPAEAVTPGRMMAHAHCFGSSKETNVIDTQYRKAEFKRKLKDNCCSQRSRNAYMQDKEPIIIRKMKQHAPFMRSMSNSAPVYCLTAGVRFEGSHQAGYRVMEGSSSCNFVCAAVPLRAALRTCNISSMSSLHQALKFNYLTCINHYLFKSELHPSVNSLINYQC